MFHSWKVWGLIFDFTIAGIWLTQGILFIRRGSGTRGAPGRRETLTTALVSYGLLATLWAVAAWVQR